MKNDVFSSVPFQKPESQEFFRLCQKGAIDEITHLLNFNKYLVYDIDNVNED